VTDTQSHGFGVVRMGNMNSTDAAHFLLSEVLEDVDHEECEYRESSEQAADHDLEEQKGSHLME